jgi:hypothetical protein
LDTTSDAELLRNFDQVLAESRGLRENLRFVDPSSWSQRSAPESSARSSALPEIASPVLPADLLAAGQAVVPRAALSLALNAPTLPIVPAISVPGPAPLPRARASAAPARGGAMLSAALLAASSLAGPWSPAASSCSRPDRALPLL